MDDKWFVDIEVGADTGLIRLYTSDENYNEYNGMEVLKMLNELHDENQELKELINYKNKTQQESLTKMQEAQKERADIKHTIKTMMENERTHIGYNTLKQLWMAIQ